MLSTTVTRGGMQTHQLFDGVRHDLTPIKCALRISVGREPAIASNIHLLSFHTLAVKRLTKRSVRLSRKTSYQWEIVASCSCAQTSFCLNICAKIAYEIEMTEQLPPLRAIRYFEAAARHLSITKAAQELHVTHCAISHQIRGLEEWLGVPLLHRANRRIALTDAGQAYMPYVRSVREALDRLANGTRQLRDLSGIRTLAVSVMPSFAAKWLIPRLGSFHRQHPEIDVRISATERVVDFDLEDIDIAIRYGSGTWPGLRADLLAAEQFVAVCSPTLLRTGKPLKRPADLALHTLLYDMRWADMWPRWFEAAGLRLNRAQRKLSVSFSGLVLQAALDGVGVALAQVALAGDDLAAGRLVKLFDVVLPGSNGYFVVTPSARTDHPHVAAFRTWLLAETTRGEVDGRALEPRQNRRRARQRGG